MNMKRTLISTLTLGALLLGACGDDDKASPKEQFKFSGETIALKEANVFLVDDDTFNEEDGAYREYIITDGEASGNGATFYIEVELGNPVDEVLETGKYPVYDNWDDAPEGSNIGYVYYENEEDGNDYVEIYPSDNADGDDFVEVSGGLEDGETMTIKFNGKLTYYHYDTETEEWVDEEIDSKIYFKGEVDDVSSVPAKIGKAVRGKRTAN
jgi:hypothetical protein